jgi:hypothetical protein
MVVMLGFACLSENEIDEGERATPYVGDVRVALDTGRETPVEPPEPLFPFDDDELLQMSLDLPQGSVDGLEHNGPYVPGTLHVEGDSVSVGVRLKGSSTFDKLDKKPSLKIAFDAFTPHQRFMGLEHLTLNAMKYDKTMMREAVAYRVFADAGVPAPRHAYASLTINGQPYGVYSVIEALDDKWLKRVLPEDHDGNLYDTRFTDSDLTDLGVSSYELQEGDPATAGIDLQELVSDLDHGNILDVLDARFDSEEVLSYLAIDLATGNYDGYSRNTNNYLLYHAPLADRWYFVPWGQDTAFSGGGRPLQRRPWARVERLRRRLGLPGVARPARARAARHMGRGQSRDVGHGRRRHDPAGLRGRPAALVGLRSGFDTRSPGTTAARAPRGGRPLSRYR